MRRSRRPILIASRRSPLARAQAQLIGGTLAQLHPGVELRYIWIDSEADQQRDCAGGDEPLSGSGSGQVQPGERGNKGLFVRAIERALLDGRADIAVHSLKDLPVEATRGLIIAATPARADVRDCLIARDRCATLADLPHAAIVGTSGPRRAAQLRRLRPDLVVKPIRGNVETRLAKVVGVGGSYHATLLAFAGLVRSGLDEHARSPLPIEQMLPAAGQAALAVQCRADDHATLTRCIPLNDPATAAAVHAERAVVAGLQGDCHSPIAVYVESVGVERFRLRARVLAPDGSVCLEVDESTTGRGLGRLSRRVVADLQARGADTVMRAVASPMSSASPDR